MREPLEVRQWIDWACHILQKNGYESGFNALAEYLGVSVRTIFRWSAQNRAPTAQLQRMIELATGVPARAGADWSGWCFVPHGVMVPAGRRRRRVLRMALQAPCGGRPWLPEELASYGHVYAHRDALQREVARLRGPAQGLLLLD